MAKSMIVLLPVVIAHAPLLPLFQQYSYDTIDPLVMTGGSHATSILGSLMDVVCTNTELRGILAGAVIEE